MKHRHDQNAGKPRVSHLGSSDAGHTLEKSLQTDPRYRRYVISIFVAPVHAVNCSICITIGRHRREPSDDASNCCAENKRGQNRGTPRSCGV